MGVYGELVDFNKKFNELDFEPVIVNDIDTSKVEEKEAFDRFLYTHYQNTDSIENSASCSCGALNTADYLGVVCGTCKTPVVSTTDKPIESILWICAPDGIDGLISPQVWSILEPVLTANKVSFLEWLINPSYVPGRNKPIAKAVRRKLDKLIEAGIERGINNFIRNFDTIIEFLFKSAFIDSNKANKGDLWAFIQSNKHLFFPQYLPIPSNLAFVIETTNSGIYIDKPLGHAMSVALTIAGIRASKYPLKPHAVQARTTKAIKELAAFYDNYIKNSISPKPGVARRHVFGTRLSLSARGVITSISEPHQSDELHVPWGMATQLLKYHIISKLMRRGYTVNRAMEFVYSNVLQYNPVLDQIFQELIEESPSKGLFCTFSRNQ